MILIGIVSSNFLKKQRCELKRCPHNSQLLSGGRKGVAEVLWQLNPDGRYYMDEDGFGMTSDEEITVYGFIDSEMNVLVKFQYIDEDWKRLDKMRREAVVTLKKNSK